MITGNLAGWPIYQSSPPLRFVSVATNTTAVRTYVFTAAVFLFLVLFLFEKIALFRRKRERGYVLYAEEFSLEFKNKNRLLVIMVSFILCFLLAIYMYTKHGSLCAHVRAGAGVKKCWVVFSHHYQTVPYVVFNRFLVFRSIDGAVGPRAYF